MSANHKNTRNSRSGSVSIGSNGRKERTLRKDQDSMPEIFKDRDMPVSSKPVVEHKPLPLWYKIIMFTLMVVGLVWVIAYYIMQGVGPIEAWGAWNITAGFTLIVVGFLMMLRWK